MHSRRIASATATTTITKQEQPNQTQAHKLSRRANSPDSSEAKSEPKSVAEAALKQSNKRTNKPKQTKQTRTGLPKKETIPLFQIKKASKQANKK